MSENVSGGLSRLRLRLSFSWRQILGVILLFALLPLVFINDDDLVLAEDGKSTKKSTKFRAAYTILIVALFWMFEVMPLAVTSLLPIVLFPFLGVMDTAQVAPTYFKETNVMFFGGLVLALAVEYCNLHKRIALRVMTIVGSEPISLLFGVMGTSMFLSMWMSNTACTAMMLPILLAVLDQLAAPAEPEKKDDPLSSPPRQSEDTTQLNTLNRRFSITHPPTDKDSLSQVVTDSDNNITGITQQSLKKQQKDRERWENIRKMYMFGVAYASNLGGTATITGTGPNLVFQAEIKKIDVSQGNKYLDMTFANWMALNVPAAVLNTLLTFLYLIFSFYYGFSNWRSWPLISRRFNKSPEAVEEEEKEKRKIKSAEKMLKQQYEALGPMSFHEIGVFVIFLFVVLLWVFRDPKFMQGWNNLLEDADIGDSTAAILGIVLMFLVPRDLTLFTGTPRKGQPYETLLDWKFVQHHLSWGVVLLLGGGFALSEGAEVSGLSEWIGSQLTSLEDLPRPVMLLIVMILTAALTEVCSNVATANVLLPILLQLSKTIKLHPLYLSVPATIACSFAFMLPVATPPNALVFSAGNLRIMDMVKTGLFLNIFCVLVYFLVHISLGELLFKYSDYEYPPEANVTRLITGGALLL